MFELTATKYHLQDESFEQLVKSSDCGKIKKVYEEQFASITTSDPVFIQMEQKLYHRILFLEKAKISQIEKKITDEWQRANFIPVTSVFAIWIKVMFLSCEQSLIENELKHLRQIHLKQISL